MDTDTHTNTHTYTHTYTYTCTHVFMRINIHIHKFTNIYKHTDMQVHKLKEYTYAYAHIDG